MDPKLLLSAEKQTKFLSFFNKLVLIAAIAVYTGFAFEIIRHGEWFGFVPITSVLLGVVLVHTFVAVALNHFALVRQFQSPHQHDES